MDVSLLNAEEKGWTNARNAEPLEKTEALVAHDEIALAWLRRNTEAIE